MNSPLFFIVGIFAVIVSIIIYFLVKIGRLNRSIDHVQIENETTVSNLSNKEKEFSDLAVRYDDLNKKYNEEITTSKNTIDELQNKYAPLINLDEEMENRRSSIDDLKTEFEILNEKYQGALLIYEGLEKEIDLYTDTLDISSYGLYQPKYDFEFPEQYLVELQGSYDKQKAMVKTHTAAICHTEWLVGGSKVEGKKMTSHEIKLMLFAFNGECDSIIAKVKWNNVSKSRERMLRSFTDINKLGSVSNIEITHDYLNLKLDELSLNYEYEKKKHEQKEEQRLIREQMREEEKAQREFERVQHEAEEEAKLYQKVLEKARQELGIASKEEAEKLNEKIKELEEKLKAAEDKKQRAISLAQTTKQGNIYVISNIGSFGEGIYKIGMTRRFDPMDRIHELSDAALPFQFDVHAIIFSENAPQFERDMHKKLWEKRINLINGRKEFFKTTIEEIESYVKESTNAQIQFTKMAEAREFRQTLSMIERLKQTAIADNPKNKFPASLLE